MQKPFLFICSLAVFMSTLPSHAADFRNGIFRSVNTADEIPTPVKNAFERDESLLFVCFSSDSDARRVDGERILTMHRDDSKVKVALGERGAGTWARAKGAHVTKMEVTADPFISTGPLAFQISGKQEEKTLFLTMSKQETNSSGQIWSPLQPLVRQATVAQYGRVQTADAPTLNLVCLARPKK